ncbi:MAG: alpha/beta fold hydrolase [Dehalococcoidia bacterium]
MATFVLVHGASHGGWCWARVARLLHDRGHAVYPLTLTGLGERAHLLNREIGLETHVQDVLNTLYFEDLREVILVGHSYGGMVIQVVADRDPVRIRHLIHFDSLVPQDGESALDLIGDDRRAALLELAKRHGDGWLLPGNQGVERFGIVDPADVAWAEPRLTPHPLRSLTDPARLSGEYLKLPKSYIDCTIKQRPSPSRVMPWARTPVWRVFELEAGHDAMVTHPAEVVRIFEEVARFEPTNA